MSTTQQNRPIDSTPPDKPGRAQRDLWSRRLAIGLPIVVVLLVLIAAIQVRSVALARDLRDDYTRLLASRRAELEQVNEAQAPARAVAPPDVRPQVTVAVSLTEFEITADTDEIPAWAAVTFEVTNDGQVPHDLSIEGVDTTPMLDAGESATLTYEASGSGP